VLGVVWLGRHTMEDELSAGDRGWEMVGSTKGAGGVAMVVERGLAQERKRSMGCGGCWDWGGCRLLRCYRASGLGLPGAPSILDVHAQAGTRGAHQAARKPGRCRDALAGAGVASGGGGVWRPGRVRPRVGVGL